MIKLITHIASMLVAFVILGCQTQPQSSQPSQTSSATTSELSWATILEQNPDAKVVTNADFLKRIKATGLPWRVQDKATGIEMLLMPPGVFTMGASQGDERAVEMQKLMLQKFPQFKYTEQPAHQVTITKPFYLGRTEVTQEQWVRVMQQNPSLFQAGNATEITQMYLKHHFVEWTGIAMTNEEARTRAETAARDDKFKPVERVSWDDCQKFCAKTGMNLPTEAQWEYACRAGVDKPTYGQLDQIAWNIDNSKFSTHSVAHKAPNTLGFYDMIGNIVEWTQDWYEGGYYKSCAGGVIDPVGPAQSELKARVLRGGGWDDDANHSRASQRGHCEPDNIYGSFGFRAARTP